MGFHGIANRDRAGLAFGVVWVIPRTMREILDIIEQALQERGMSARRASLEAGGTPETIRDMRRGRVPSVERVRALCRVLGLEFYMGPRRGEARTPPLAADSAESAMVLDGLTALREELRSGLADLRRDVGVLVKGADLLADPRADAPHVQHVEVRELRAAAGGGATDLDETVTGYLTFRRDWLDENGLTPSQCTVIRVKGESMEPTLPDGCAILIDRNRRRRLAGHIFTLRTEDGLVVKRLGRSPDAGWQLVSEHPAYPPAAWTPGTEIIGEVKWMARTFP